MTRTTNERIASYNEQIAQLQNRKKQLLQKHRKDERKARTNRLCKRAGLLEKMLPDTIKLTDEHFETLLKRTIANSFGRKELAEIVAENTEATTPKPAKTASQGSKPDTAPQGETPKRNGEAAAPEVAKTSEGGGSVSAHGAEITEDKGS